MTNFPAIVIVTLLTNVTEDIHPDGSRKAVVEDVVKQRVCHWVEDGNACSLTNVIRVNPPKVRMFRRVWQPIEVTPPPLPTSSMRLQSVPPPAPGVTNTMIVSPRFDNGSEGTNEYCRMFRVDFATETNWIYGLESSIDLVNWQPCPPEIDGTGQPDYFFDADSDHKSYRLVLREGVLPEEVTKP
jgi:hypothetical protein